MSTTIIKVKQLYKSYLTTDSSIDILKNINLEIQAGEFVAIVGQSGSGKSTLMNILGCLDKPTRGSYHIFNKEVSQLAEDQLAELRREHFGFIFQKYQLLSNQTALENVEIPAIYSGLPLAQREKRAKQLLTQLGLGDRLNYKPGQLSGGQQQRVSIARALMNGGDIIFADEPTGALDSHSGAEVMAILKELNNKGHTIIMVTHDPNLAKQANRVIEIKDGEIIKDSKHAVLSGQQIRAEEPITHYSHLGSIYDSLRENFKMAIRSIVSNKMRALLTMLGIIIGISSVISMVAIGNGTTNKLLNQIGKETIRSIYIFPGNEFRATNLAIPAKRFTDDDLKFLRSLPYVYNIVPNNSVRGVMQYNQVTLNASIQSCDQSCVTGKDLTLVKGNGFNKQFISKAALVGIIDEPTEKELFPNQNPLGKMILTQGVPIEVIGVVKQKQTWGQRKIGVIYLPYTTLATRFVGNSIYSGFSLTAKPGYSIPSVKEQIEKIFISRHDGIKDFEIMTADEQLEEFRQTSNGLKLFILIMAIISLLVGGIGVMNIMLVSVTERTQEIGVRMAVGARQTDIKQQFLIEAIILCVIGGIIGIILAFLLGNLVNLYASSNPDSLLSFAYSVNSIIISVLFSSLIGIIFGYIPAKNASKLDPVVALTKE